MQRCVLVGDVPTGFRGRGRIYILRGLLLLGLGVLFLNPITVTEKDGSIEPSQVFYLLDASESMAIGNQQATRWDQALNIIRESAESAYESAAARVSLFRFGRRLKAVASPEALGLDDKLSNDGMGVTFEQKMAKEEGRQRGSNAVRRVRRDGGYGSLAVIDPKRM